MNAFLELRNDLKKQEMEKIQSMNLKNGNSDVETLI